MPNRSLLHRSCKYAHFCLRSCLAHLGLQDKTIAVWEMASANEVNLRRTLVGHRAAVNVVDLDRRYIVSASGDRTIKVWSTSSCEFVRTLSGHRRGIACLQYRDPYVVSGSSDNTIRCVNWPNHYCMYFSKTRYEYMYCYCTRTNTVIHSILDISTSKGLN